MGRAAIPEIVQVNIYGLTLAEILQKGANIPHWLSTFGIENCTVFEVPRPTSCNRLGHRHEISTFSSISSFDCDYYGGNDDNLESIVKIEDDNQETPKPLFLAASTPRPNEQADDNLFNCSLNDLSVNDNNFDHHHLDPIYEENEDIMDSFSVLSDSVIDVMHYILNIVEIAANRTTKNTNYDLVETDDEFADANYLTLIRSQDCSPPQSSHESQSSSTAFCSIPDDNSNVNNSSGLEHSSQEIPSTASKRSGINSSMLEKIQRDFEGLFSSPVEPAVSFEENVIGKLGEQLSYSPKAKKLCMNLESSCNEVVSLVSNVSSSSEYKDISGQRDVAEHSRSPQDNYAVQNDESKFMSFLEAEELNPISHDNDISHTPGFNFSEDIPSLKKDVGDKAIILKQEEREYDLVEDDDGVAYESLYEEESRVVSAPKRDPLEGVLLNFSRKGKKCTGRVYKKTTGTGEVLINIGKSDITKDTKIVKCALKDCHTQVILRRGYGRDRLINHVRTHVSKKDCYKCTLCDYSHRTEKNIRYHHSQKHRDVKFSGATKLETVEDFKQLLILFKTCFPGWGARLSVDEVTLDNLPEALYQNRYLGIDDLVKFQNSKKRESPANQND